MLRSRDRKRLVHVTGLAGDGGTPRIRALARELAELLFVEHGAALHGDEVVMFRARMTGLAKTTGKTTLAGDET